MVNGGFGEKIAGFYGDSPMKVLSFGAAKEFVDLVEAREQYQRYHLTEDQIVEDIMKINI